MSISYLSISANNPQKFKPERKPAAAIQQEVYYESLGGMESI